MDQLAPELESLATDQEVQARGLARARRGRSRPPLVSRAPSAQRGRCSAARLPRAQAARGPRRTRQRNRRQPYPRAKPKSAAIDLDAPIDLDGVAAGRAPLFRGAHGGQRRTRSTRATRRYVGAPRNRMPPVASKSCSLCRTSTRATTRLRTSVTEIRRFLRAVRQRHLAGGEVAADRRCVG